MQERKLVYLLQVFMVLMDVPTVLSFDVKSVAYLFSNFITSPFINKLYEGLNHT